MSLFLNLAPVYNEVIKQLIVQTKEEKCIVVTDHFYQDVWEISDELYLIKEGYTRKVNSKEELIQHDYIRSF